MSCLWLTAKHAASPLQSVCGLCVESKSPDRVEVLSLEYDDGINVDLGIISSIVCEERLFCKAYH